MVCRYRTLNEGDTIQLGDEGLRPDCEHWSPLTESNIVLGLRYAPGFHAPMRRPIRDVQPPPTFADMGEDDLRDLLARALSFRFDDRISIAYRGSTGWAATTGSATINTDLEAEYEPMPSGRDDEYIARTRFSLEGAFAIAHAYVEQEKSKGLHNGA